MIWIIIKIAIIVIQVIGGYDIQQNDYDLKFQAYGHFGQQKWRDKQNGFKEGHHEGHGQTFQKH